MLSNQIFFRFLSGNIGLEPEPERKLNYFGPATLDKSFGFDPQPWSFCCFYNFLNSFVQLV